MFRRLKEERRNERVVILLTSDEFDELKDRAIESGSETLSGYIRKVLFKGNEITSVQLEKIIDKKIAKWFERMDRKIDKLIGLR